MSAIDNRSAVKRREIEIRVKDRQYINDLQYVMSSPEGRRVMEDLLNRCGVGRLSFAPLAGADGIAAALQTAFNEGMRNIGNYYWGKLTKNLKEQWLLMTEEAEKAEEINHGRSNDGPTADSGDDRSTEA